MSIRTLKTPTALLRFGMARAEITPPIGIYHRMWGAARHDQSTGVHRPLVGDVLALGPDGSERPAWVRAHLDLVGLAPEQHERLAAALGRGAGIPRQRVVLAYSHSHAAGLFTPNRIPLPGGDLIPGYLDDLEVKLEETARLALDAYDDAVFTCALGQCAMNANRDFPDEEYGAPVCGFNPEGETDDSVLAVRVTDPAGALRASLVHYACHPTTLAWDNTLLSPDYPGEMRETVEGQTGSPCVFVLGGCGELGPQDGFVGDPAVADRNGRQLAHAALSALASLAEPGTDFAYAGPVISGATIGTWARVPFSEARREEAARFTGGTYSVDLPLKPLPERSFLEAEVDRYEGLRRAAEAAGDPVTARDCGARAERARRWIGRIDGLPPGETYAMRYSVMRMGDLVWVACGGEPYSALQAELRRRFPDFRILVSPLADGMQVAYLLPRDRYGLGLYQEEPSLLAPGCLEQLTEAVAARIAGLAAS